MLLPFSLGFSLLFGIVTAAATALLEFILKYQTFLGPLSQLRDVLIWNTH